MCLPENWANPIAIISDAESIAMASESVNVELSGDSVRVSGSFVYVRNRPSVSHSSERYVVYVPLIVPIAQERGDVSITDGALTQTAQRCKAPEDFAISPPAGSRIIVAGLIDVGVLAEVTS